MRTYVLAIVGAALFALPTSAFSQELIWAGRCPNTPLPSSGYGADCRELRQACLHKEELGEQGQGNCRRYREVCQGR